MSNKSLATSGFYLKKGVEAILRKKGGTPTSGKVISELSFGFWTSLFDTHHFKLINGVLMKCFPNKPPGSNRKVINQKLHKVRKFRNRVYHNEPICFNGPSINLDLAKDIKTDIYELLNWIDSDLSVYVRSFDTVDDEISLANHL